MAFLFSEKEYLTYDDVLIRPSFSNIKTRDSISTAPEFLGLSMKIPIISANMDFVTGADMAIAMWKAGGLGILHRFADHNTLISNAAYVSEAKVPLIVSIGVKNGFYMATVYESFGLHAVCIDVAHGDHEMVVDLIKKLKAEMSHVKIIAGNVATFDGFYRLVEAGADATKVGIGPGSVCTTRTVTGVGVPQLSAIMEINDARERYGSHVKIIADGGIKNSGDIVKALAAGADTVMLGNLLAGATECPGPVVEVGDGRRYRSYRGQSIFGTNGLRETPEGISGYVEDKGPVEAILKRLTGGLRSGMSYVGASNLNELREAEFIKVTPLSHIENGTRVQVKL